MTDTRKEVMEILQAALSAAADPAPHFVLDRHQNLINDLFSPDLQTAQELAAALTHLVYDRARKFGFMRKAVHEKTLHPGELCLLGFKNRPTKTVIATNQVSGIEVEVHDKLLTPPEYPTSAKSTISASERFPERMPELLLNLDEQTWVREDRLFVDLMRMSPPVTLYDFPLDTFDALCEKVNDPVNCFISFNVLTDVMSDEKCRRRFTPVASYELLTTGLLGYMDYEGARVGVFSDAYRDPQHRVLSRDEMFVTGDPSSIGQYTDRGYTGTLVIDEEDSNGLARGVSIESRQSMVLINSSEFARSA